MTNSPFRFGPIALTTTTTTNLLNPVTTTGGVNAGSPNSYLMLRHVRVVSKTTAAATFSLYLGGSTNNTAGTEVIGNGLSVAANSYVDWYGYLKLDVADYLVGGSNTATALTIEGEGEMGLVM